MGEKVIILNEKDIGILLHEEIIKDWKERRITYVVGSSVITYVYNIEIPGGDSYPGNFLYVIRWNELSKRAKEVLTP